MAGCPDNEDWFQDIMSAAPANTFGPDVTEEIISVLTCSSMVSDPDACSSKDPGMFDVVCASSCKYHGPCTGDEALAVFFSDDDDDIADGDDDDFEMTCATLPAIEATLSLLSGTDDAAALTAAMFPIAREICGLPPASQRARKMTDAPPVDASKVHKLAAAMLRSTKTMAHRLAQVRGLGQ
jgi:hypothetical protein